MKKHVILVSSNFLKSHPRAGEPTGFPFAIEIQEKLHTLRTNYEYWKKKIDEVNEGLAVLIIRTWSGKPYKSKQRDIKTLGKGECGIQKCQVFSDAQFVFVDDEQLEQLDRFSIEENDGLSVEDFWNWFTNDVKDGCIIHFTNKKY